VIFLIERNFWMAQMGHDSAVEALQRKTDYALTSSQCNCYPSLPGNCMITLEQLLCTSQFFQISALQPRVHQNMRKVHH